MEEIRQNGNKVSIAVISPIPEKTIKKKPRSIKKHYIKLKITDDVPTIIKRCVAEFLGTAILLFVGCMSCCFDIIPPPILMETIGFGFGIAVTISVQTFGHISGSHINPAVTLGAIICGYMPLLYLPFYVLSQVAGAIAGYGILYALVPEVKTGNVTIGLCSNFVSPKLTTMQGFGVEFVITLILVIFCGGVWDVRNANKHDSVPIKFGLAIAGLAMVAAPLSSASMNPARSFAPALINNDWDDHWVFWAGPIAGGITGALIYRLIFEYKEPISQD